MAENTAVAEKKAFTTSLSEWSNTMTGLIINDYNGIMGGNASSDSFMSIPDNVADEGLPFN